MIFLFAIIYLLCITILTYLSVEKLEYARRLVFKILTSFLFVLIFVFIGITKKDFTKNILIAYIGALSLSFIGDVLLGIYNYTKKNKTIYFYVGTAAFFIAQIFYIGFFAFKDGFEFNIFYLIIPFAAYVASIIGLERMKVKKSILLVGSTYILAVSFMFASTFVFGIKNGNTIVPSAGLLFLFSDFSLAIKYFQGKENKLITILTTVTYYLAQILLVLYLY